MARRVYFAFDYRDVFNVNGGRRSGQFVGVARAGYVGASHSEQLKKRDPTTIQVAIDHVLQGRSVTVAVVGPSTASRQRVNYELNASIARDDGLPGVVFPGESGQPEPAALTRTGAPLYAFASARFADWVEVAARRTGPM
jgi:MTH538 TIR-like domain (DUF1863)